MDTREAIANRIRELCKEHNVTPNGISHIAAVPQATIKSILALRQMLGCKIPMNKIYR